MNDLLKGAAKSKTVWVAAVIAVVAQVAPYAPEICAAAGVNPATVKLVGSICGALMAAMRVVTTNALADKVAPAVLPAPQSQVGDSSK